MSLPYDGGSHGGSEIELLQERVQQEGMAQERVPQERTLREKAREFLQVKHYFYFPLRRYFLSCLRINYTSIFPFFFLRINYTSIFPFFFLRINYTSILPFFFLFLRSLWSELTH
tara:strand:+ start:1317 stop:1661 length:345 start_codon:yes stop_codon:yes gene_type:complete